MSRRDQKLIKDLTGYLTQIISETNGISIQETLELASASYLIRRNLPIHRLIVEFRQLLSTYQQDIVEMETLLDHPVSHALYRFFNSFPLKYKEEHSHLTGSLNAEFIYPRLKKLLEGPNKAIYEQKIVDIYGPKSLPIKDIEDVDHLIRLQETDIQSSTPILDDPFTRENKRKGAHFSNFDRYLRILTLPKLILTDRAAHVEAAYHMATTLYNNFNVGQVRLKFTLSRVANIKADSIPGIEGLKPEDVLLGLYEGFKRFHDEHPDFNFVLSPSFRKEPNFFNAERFKTKGEDFLDQVNFILAILKKHPELKPFVCDVDTVGNEKNLYKKSHFLEMQEGFRKLQDNGICIRSHHGEIWNTLRLGVQAVDNALNIWHVDTLEHGISLGINPNYYFHSLFERILMWNKQGIHLKPGRIETRELKDMEWGNQQAICKKILEGEKLSPREISQFAKVKLNTAREIEHYQHDVLNRMIYKRVGLTSLPSSNIKLTGRLPDYKDHPFSWWEKKGVQQSVGTDNYITLDTDMIKEMLILLFSDSKNLKITKLLMVTTGEQRRPYISKLLWNMRKNLPHRKEEEAL